MAGIGFDFSIDIDKGKPIAQIMTVTSKKGRRKITDTGSYVGLREVKDDGSQQVNANVDFENTGIAKYVLTQTPDPLMKKKNQREVLYVSGPSGSGKSTYTADYVRNYHRDFPNDAIVMFSAVSDDDAFKKIPLIRVVLDETFIDRQLSEDEDTIRIEDLSDSLVIFDDIDVIHNDEVKKLVQKLRSECLEIGRHQNISMILTSHQIFNYKETRIILNEANYVVTFPRSGSAGQIRDYFRRYAGFNKKEIDDIMSIKTRWICFSKTAPQYILHQTGARLLN